METSERLSEILKKIDADVPLDREENLLYLRFIFGVSLQEAKRILAITENTDPNVLID